MGFLDATMRGVMFAVLIVMSFVRFPIAMPDTLLSPLAQPKVRCSSSRI